MSTPSLAIFDDWIADPELLEALTSTVEDDFQSKQGAPEESRYNWWDGELPTLPIHRYIAYTHKKLGAIYDLDCEGYEWWGNYNSTVGWHYDKDELRYRERRELLHPIVGTVLYLSGTEQIDGLGGAFAVNSDSSEKTADQVYPVKNRLVVFRGNRLHRICQYKGQRISLAVNFWSQVPLAFERQQVAT